MLFFKSLKQSRSRKQHLGNGENMGGGGLEHKIMQKCSKKELPLRSKDGEKRSGTMLGSLCGKKPAAAGASAAESTIQLEHCSLYVRSRALVFLTLHLPLPLQATISV